jgi:uncharacterized membrane protein YhaH (DUF805 family)
MSGFDYFKKCVTTHYAEFNGRARRTEYWFFVLFATIIAMLLLALGYGINTLFQTNNPIVFMAPITLFLLALFIPSIAVSVRRLHDTNKSGWYYLISLIPYIGGLVMLIFYFTPGDKGENNYGDDPINPSTSKIIDDLV